MGTQWRLNEKGCKYFHVRAISQLTRNVETTSHREATLYKCHVPTGLPLSLIETDYVIMEKKRFEN